MSFMLPFFKESTSTNEEYADFMDEAEQCNMMSEVFDEAFERSEASEVKPNLTYRPKRQEDNYECQELNPADPLDVFLITIGATLRKFSPYHLNQAKSKIFQVVQDYELQQIVNKDASGSDTNR